MKRVQIIYPLLLSLAVAGGILLGVNLEKRTALSDFPAKFYQSDKLSAMLNLIEKDYVDSVNRDELIEKAIPEVLTQLDPHTVYIPEKEMQSVNEDMQGNFTGIGVQFTIERDTIMVIDVISGGPSQKLGLMPGDRIVQINDTVVAGKTIKNEDVFSKLRGKKGTHVKVDIKRSGVTKLISFDIERGEIPIFSVDVSYLLNENTGYIKVSRFSEKTYDEFLNAIEKLTKLGAQKLVVDLRGNPGGYLEIVIRMVDEFLPAGKMIVYTEGKSRSRKEYHSSSKGLWKDKDVVVLIDEFSASASEIFAGAIQDNDRGLIVGRRSFGKGLVQEPIPFIDGSTLRLTVARYYTPSGRCIQKPYTEGNNEYMKDLVKRMDKGEFSQKDSIHFNDSLKFKTTEGRTVYGGGGIMPDVFVPADTTGYNEFFGKVMSKNYIYHFAFEYSDSHRNDILKLKTPDAIEKYLDKENVFERFLGYLKKNGIFPSTKELTESGKIMNVQIKALIARNCIGDEGFYSIIDKQDKTVLKAVELLKKEWSKQAIVQLK